MKNKILVVGISAGLLLERLDERGMIADKPKIYKIRNITAPYEPFIDTQKKSNKSDHPFSKFF